MHLQGKLTAERAHRHHHREQGCDVPGNALLEVRVGALDARFPEDLSAP